MYALLKSRNEQPAFTSSTSVNEKKVCAIKAELSPALRRKLLYMHVTSFDWERGGLKTPIKFLDRDSIEYSLTQAACYDRTEENMARLSLDAGLKLIDPVWGGIYQFSTGNSWLQPHHSKTMAAQAGCLRLYSLAYGQLHELRYLTAARMIYRYLRDFLLDADAGFYAGQDNVVAGIDPHQYFALSHRQRLRYGKPSLDINFYGRENAWAIEALASFFEFSGEKSARELAIRTAKWLLQSFRCDENGIKHSLTDQHSLLLGDNLATARAMLQLYRITAEPRYLEEASLCVKFIAKHFKAKNGGFNTRRNSIQGATPSQQIDENISLCRFLNLLSFYTKKTRYKKLAIHALRYLITPQVATARMEEAGVLLAEEESGNSPVQITIHGKKTDMLAGKLFDTALRAYGWYKLIHWREAEEPTPAYARIENGRYRSDRIDQADKLAWLIKSV